MEEKRINERESLDIITAMIDRTKERYMLGDGNIFLMWGYLTVAVSVLVWILLAVTHNPSANWLWYLIWIIGGIATPIMTKKRTFKKGAKSYSDKIISQIWSIVGFSAIAATFMCLGFLFINGVHTWNTMFAFALIIVPFAEIAQGIVVNEKSFIFGGGIGLVAGIFTICCIAGNIPLQASWYMPTFILSFVCMMIIPGHILNHKSKNNERA